MSERDAPPWTCPTCARAAPREGKAFPFCSPRCRLIDLGRWAGGDYKVSRALEPDDLEEAARDGLPVEGFEGFGPFDPEP